MFFDVCLHLCLFPLRTDWQKSDCSIDGEPQGNLRWNSNSRDVVSSSPSFSCPATRVPRRACSQATSQGLNSILYLRKAADTFSGPFLACLDE